LKVKGDREYVEDLFVETRGRDKKETPQRDPEDVASLRS
jgi:hypothetical protein